MSAQPTLLGSRGLVLRGAVRTECKALPPQMGNWKKRLPTIAEDGEELEDVSVRGLATASSTLSRPASTPSLALAMLPESLTDPLSIISNTDHASVVAQRLKDSSKTDRRQLFTWLLKALPALAVSEAGSKVAQVALEIAMGTDRDMITSGFHGSILNLCTSPHGREVVVTLVQNMPASCIEFVVNEIEGHCMEIACDKNGSCVLVAMTMHCSPAQIAKLGGELVDEAAQLSRHPRASSVIQNLLEYAPSECQTAIGQSLIPEAPKLAMHKPGSHVVEKALHYCDVEERQAMARVFLQANSPSAVVDVACSRCGSSILEEIAKSEFDTAEFRSQLSTALPRLGKSKFGRRVLVHFGLMSQTST